MSDYFSARDRIEAWIKAFDELAFPSDRLAVASNGEARLLSDVKTLLEKLAGPCGSCHPCTNYADETWRAAGRTPPHVYQWDGAKASLAAVAAVCDKHEQGAERWDDPLPTPEWIPEIRAALAGGEPS